MAKVKFLQPRKLGEKRYPKGVCEVPEADCKGWFWDEMEKCGDLVKVSDEVQATAHGLPDKAQGSVGGPPRPKAEAPAHQEAKRK